MEQAVLKNEVSERRDFTVLLWDTWYAKKISKKQSCSIHCICYLCFIPE